MKRISTVGMRFLMILMISFLGFSSYGQENIITNLYDSFGDDKGELIKDWGFSALINYNGKLILFDGGSSADILKHNAEVVGADLSMVEIAVLSHSHYDHISGLDYLLEINPKVKLFLPFDRTIGGRPTNNDQDEEWNKNYRRGYRFKDADVTYIKENTEIASGFFLITTTSKLMGWYSKYPPYDKEPLTLGLPELSLAIINNQKEWTLIVACSHSQVEEIVVESNQYLDTNISGVVGGYHLFPYSNEYISKWSEMLKNELKVNWIAPAHCTGEVAHKQLEMLYGENYKHFGLGSIVKF